MNREGPEGFFEALGDIFKEVSPIFRITIVLGLISGLVTAWWVGHAISGGSEAGTGQIVALRFIAFITIVIILAGGFLGLVAGVIVELIWEKIFGPPAKKKPKRRK